MTEEQWLSGADLFEMCKVPAVAESKRKVRLFGVACCRRLARWWHDPRLAKAVNAAEKYADGGLKLKTLERWNTAANEAQATGPQPTGGQFPPEWQANHAVLNTTHYDEYVSCGRHAMVVWRTLQQAEGTPAEEVQDWLCRLLRDIFGNPFRSVAFDPGWRSDTAVSLARGMYEGRDFAAMPILADALQDAGCDRDAVLTHCRAGGATHVRGCWVVDLVLGKA